MIIHPIAPMYWNSVQAGNRTFSKVPPEVQPSVKELARQDAKAGRISPEQYLLLMGEPYQPEVQADVH